MKCAARSKFLLRIYRKCSDGRVDVFSKLFIHFPLRDPVFARSHNLNYGGPIFSFQIDFLGQEEEEE